MANIDFKKVEQINQGYKDIVNGFIREIEKELLSANQKNAYYFVPRQANILTVAYYHLYSDEWDKSKTSKNILFSDDGMSVHSEIGTWNSVFGKNMVSEGTHKWDLEITKITKETTNSIDIMIGVCKDEWCSKVNSNLSNHYEQMLVFHASEAGAPRYTKYGEKFEKVGHTIQIILDMDKRTLSYVINGNEYGPAFENIPKGSYRLALAICRWRTVTLK